MLAVADTIPARSQAERAYWLMVDRIIRLDMPPGSVLLDRELTAELGIGRTPVREALQRLAGEGLVVHYPHRGMVVSEISATSTRDIYEFRSLIDSEAARLAAMRRSEAEAERLGNLAAALADCAAGSDVDSYVGADRAFYDALGEACGNVYIAETIPRIFNLHLRLWFYISKMQGGWHALAQAHSAMAVETAEAVRARDPDRAALSVRAYISQRQKDMRALI
ncbi:MAG: GntR family transcriptional regulator [Paracoccaceae bacterium]|nr:GntR family transcriptional regulator [Paracoccaceae bacterium]